MILGLCATRRRALEEQTTFFAHYYIQYVSDRLNSSSNPEVFMPDDPMALSCVDGSFYARVNLSDFDVCRLRSCVRPFDAVDNTAGLDEVRALGPNQISELVSPD